MSGFCYLSQEQQPLEDSLGRVECFAFPGIDLWFNSSDHDPPHFHARKPGVWEIRVYFRSCTEHDLDFSTKFLFHGLGPSRRERRGLLDLVLAHQGELYEEWEAKVCL